jgi:OPA family sugar phosphate sensor protein UhpC-like MFS transporter
MPLSKASGLLASAILGYIGIYLCRKNLSVAVPMLKDHFHVSKAEIGAISSFGTIAYMVGKVLFGPVIDRFGGRACFLFAMGGTAVFCGLGAFAPSLPVLMVFYSLNRFSGAAGWGSMAKQVPDWFAGRRLALPLAFLSLSFVFGGACATAFASVVAKYSHDNWHAVLGLPSIVLLGIIIASWFVLPRHAPASVPANPARPRRPNRWVEIAAIVKIPQFWVVCGLSFVLTITRETFNDWAPDFFKTSGGPQMTNTFAGFLALPFDVIGAAGILFFGWILDLLSGLQRRLLLFTTLVALAGLIYGLPEFITWGLVPAAIALGLIGFLSYGPYSLLAGVFSVEIRGKESVGTVAGFVDASGYLGGGILAGYFFGSILDHGGYVRGFHLLAAITSLAAILCLFLKGGDRRGQPA